MKCALFASSFTHRYAKLATLLIIGYIIVAITPGVIMLLGYAR
jgi:hypothetical protein